jgi:hypothetical protein
MIPIPLSAPSRPTAYTFHPDHQYLLAGCLSRDRDSCGQPMSTNMAMQVVTYKPVQPANTRSASSGTLCRGSIIHSFFTLTGRRAHGDRTEARQVAHGALTNSADVQHGERLCVDSFLSPSPSLPLPRFLLPHSPARESGIPIVTTSWAHPALATERQRSG